MNKSCISILVVLFAAVIMTTNAGGRAGGLGESKPVDSGITELVERLKPKIIEKICENSAEKCPTADSKIAVNSYKTQVVAGTNYFVGLTIDDISYHARIFSQPWTSTEEVHSVTGPKQLGAEIEYF